MTIADFEKAVWEHENIRIIIRAPKNKTIGDYSFQNRCDEKFSIKKWLDTRITKVVGAFDVVVVNGLGDLPNQRTKLQTVRQSYLT